MKHFAKRITALLLLLLMTASLLVSCGEKPKRESDKSIPIYDSYAGSVVDIGLTENETVLDIIEVDGELRATIGVTNVEIEEIYGAGLGTPYQTEYRYYSADFVENSSKREKSIATHEITTTGNGLAFGGEPYMEDSSCFGVQYFFYRNGESLGKNVMPPLDGWDDDNDERSELFGATAHVMLHEDTIYAGIHYSTWPEWHLYVNGHMVEMPDWRPGAPEYQFCGLIGIAGVPYALLHVWGEEKDEQMVDILYENARLVPLSPDITELSLEGTDIDGVPTGGAFSTGKYGYFMCGSELWRTDGKDSRSIADLIFFGVSEASEVRSIRLLSDGRILVAVDGKLIELSGSNGNSGDSKKVFTVGVINLYGNVSDLTLTFSKFNGISEDVVFTVKEYDDQADLNLAILSGEISMVVSRDQFMLKNYVKQNLLSPMDEVAPELFGEGVLIDNIVEATKVDGICYYLPRHFDIRGEMTNSKLLKEGQSFETRKEYYNYLAEQDPGYFKAITKRTLFTYFAQGIDEWIDWETNAAHFDDGTFAELLEFCENGSSQEEVDQYTSVPFSMNTSNFVLGDSIANNRVKDLAEAQAYLEKIASAQEGESFIQGAMVTFPLPSAVHEGYEIFAPHYFAVVDNENTQEAAGEFLRWHFLEDIINEFSSSGWYGDQFSINRDEVDRYLIRNIDGFVEIPEDADESERLVYTYENMNKGKAQYDRTWEIIRQGDHFQYFRNEVFDVMYEEAGRFFSGSITAKQAAEYVQNRVSLYLAEQS